MMSSKWWWMIHTHKGEFGGLIFLYACAHCATWKPSGCPAIEFVPQRSSLNQPCVQLGAGVHSFARKILKKTLAILIHCYLSDMNLVVEFLFPCTSDDASRLEQYNPTAMPKSHAYSSIQWCPSFAALGQWFDSHVKDERQHLIWWSWMSWW